MDNEIIKMLIDKLNVNDTKGHIQSELVHHEIKQNKALLFKHRDELKTNISKVEETIAAIEELSKDARITAKVKMSKFIEVDCLLKGSEYFLKSGDYYALSSVHATIDYCKRSIQGMKGELVKIEDHLLSIDDQEQLAKASLFNSAPVEVIKDGNSTITKYDNGLVEILEDEEEPYVKKGRSPRFKTVAERDEYLKRQNKENLN